MAFEFQTHAKRHFEHYAPTSRDAASGVPLIAQSMRTGRLEWRQIQNSPCVALLGEPNIGKSREFEHQHKLLKDQGTRSIITRLKDWLPAENILETEAELRAALDSGEEFHWFVDALDEGRLQWPELFAGLFRLLRDLQKEGRLGRMRLRLSCRAREWKQHEQERLATLFEDNMHEHPGMVVVRMLPIDEASARELIAEKLGADIQVQHFLDTCQSNNVLGLVGFPLLLASNLLCSVAAGDYADRLKSGVALSPKNDPEDEIAGALLTGLYPEHMSVDEALALFHVPRSAMQGKRFKDFWSKAFWADHLDADQRQHALQAFADAFQQFDNLAAGAPEADHQRILGGMTRGVRSVFEAFCEQLKAEAEAPGRDLNILGPWLLTASNWSRRYMLLAPQPLSAASDAGQLRAEVLRWAAAAAPKDRDLRPASDIPYFRDAFGIADLDLLIDLIRDHVKQPRISVPMFSAVLGLWMSSASKENRQDLGLVAGLSPELLAAAEQFKRARLQSEEEKLAYAEMLEAEATDQGESPHRPLDSAEIEAIKAGSVDSLLEQLIHSNTDIASQEFSQRLENLPVATKDAAKKGALAAWTAFSDSSVLWSRNHVQNTFSVSPGVLSAVVGFWLYCKTLDSDDDLQLTPSQAELVIWMARESYTEFERLLGAVWARSNAVARSRLQALLEVEDQQSPAVGQTLWDRLRDRVNLPPDLVDFVKAFAFGHLEAKSTKVRGLVFAFLRRHANAAQLLGLVPSLEAAGLAWVADRFDGPAEEPALRSLAMAWLIDGEAIGRFGSRVFSGPNHLRRAHAFTSAISDITQPGRIPLGWAEPIDVESLGGLVPHLYFKDEKAQAATMSGMSMLGRDHVFRRMLEAKDDGPQVLRLLAKWKNDERFGDWRSYLTDEHAKLQRRLSEEAWSPMDRDAAAALLRWQGNVVRGARDVVYFMDELIETKLAPSFRTDHSLTPLLWGKKDENDPRDEKDVPADYGEGLYGENGLMRGVVVFVPFDERGVSKGKPLEKLGQRPLPQGEIFFDEVHVPRRYVLGDEGAFQGQFFGAFTLANMEMACVFSGLARAAFEQALAYVHERRQGGALLIEHQP